MRGLSAKPIRPTMEEIYRPDALEREARQYWEDNASFSVRRDDTREKFYCLSMLPYPSGKLHMGHVRNYTIGDVISRYQRMCGRNVLQPMGWDAFGMPAENAAIEHNVPPAAWTADNIDEMRRQLKLLGFAYDWDREVATCHPEYYRWEQWFFTRLFEKGLAYKKTAEVNWCETDQTVLANEQVVDGRCWRCDNPVVRRDMDQWFMRITAYAQELLDDIDKLEHWPEQVRTMQRNWIGRSEGVTMRFGLAQAPPGGEDSIEVYTTRPDTLMGATCIAVAPRHPVAKYAASLDEAVAAFVEEESRRTDGGHEYAADTWADWYADRHDIVTVNSGEFDGLDFEGAFRAIADRLESEGKGERTVNFRLRDWGVSRQRYWGAPIPIVYCDDCGTLPVPERDLPVVLPTEVTFEGIGSPIKKMPEFHETSCPSCGGAATRETDTFDTFMESSWYYLRYTCARQGEAMLDAETNYWAPVDQYVGGIEHAVLHLLYARFYHKLLRDEGIVESDEPFTRLLTQGMVLKDGAKMSKSKGNTVDPQTMIDRYGADTVRLFSMFAAAPEQSLEWSDSGVEGAHRFLRRLWKLVAAHLRAGEPETLDTAALDDRQKAVRRKTHETIAKVTDDFSRRRTFNTAIAAIMELCNELGNLTDRTGGNLAVEREALRAAVLMLNPIVPHICHRLWRELTGEAEVTDHPWPVCDEAALARDSIEMVVQVNGKVRARMEVAANLDRAAIEASALAQNNVRKFIEGNTLRKVIVVPGKLVNIVAN